MVRRRNLVVAALAALAILLPACSSADSTSDGGEGGGTSTPSASATTSETSGGTDAGSGEPIDVAAQFELSGGVVEAFGVPGSRGVELAIDKINEEGGIELDGEQRPLRLVLEDNQGDPSTAVGLTEAFIQEQGFHTMFGPLTSLTAPPTAEVTQSLDAIQFTPSAALTNVAGTEGNEHLFVTQLDEATRARIEVGYYMEQFEISTVAGLNVNNSGTDGYWPEIVAAFEEQGVEVVSDQRFEPGTSDFAPLLSNARQAEPDALYFGWGPDATDIVRQAGELQVADILLSRAVTPDVFVDAGLPAEIQAAGTANQPNLTEPTSAQVEDYLQRYEAKYGEAPSPTGTWALTYYDFVSMWAQAVEEVGNLEDVDAIADALRSIRYEGAMTVAFSEDNVAIHDFDAFTLDGDEVSWTRLTPEEFA